MLNLKVVTEACACATSLAFLNPFIAGIQVLVIRGHHSRTINSLICNFNSVPLYTYI